MFLKNAWYVAARGADVARRLTPVTLLGEAVVLYRTAAGKIAALEDACPHRKLPLSMGRLKGDQVECGYHGLTFASTGACVHAPGAARIPHAARVRAYPAEERYGLVWVWMGDAARADPDLIFDVEHWGDPAWGVTECGSMLVDCDYRYITDNLLDPSHVAWVHRTSFGDPACEETPLEIALHPDGVTVSRWMLDTPPAPFYAPFLKFSGRCDRKQEYEVRYPCHALIKAIFVPAGSGGGGGPWHEDVFLMDSYNFMTPVTERQTRYYWFQMRNFLPGDEEVSQRFGAAVRAAFEEDLVILNAVQKGMDNRRTPNLDLAIDAGPLRFRRQLDRLIAAEAGALAAAE